MRISVGSLASIIIIAVLPSAPSRAEDVADTLTTAWESFWQQSGYPRAVFKWQEPIRVKFSGVTPERHKDFALRQIRETASVAGISVTETAADDATANVNVEFMGTAAPLPANQPCVTSWNTRNGVMRSAKIRANEQSVWRCMLHETMHLMGLPGHPLRNSILTYFARGGQLTNVDKLLLKTIYSTEVELEMSPFAVLEVLARHIVNSTSESARNDARQAADVFLRKTIADMEAFGNGSGEAPVVILRSGKATAQGLKRGQTDVQYFLGLAYLRGHIVEPDPEKALGWFRKAAAASHGGATVQLRNVTQK